MAEEIIKCTIVEEKLFCNIQDSTPINVTLESGGVSERIWELLNLYLIKEDLSSQVTEGVTDLITINNFYSDSLNVFINGLKEKDIIILTNNSFRVSPALDNGDTVEVEFVKKVE